MKMLQTTECFRAEIIGDNTAVAPGITAHGHAPVLILCRKLLDAGYDPATPLEAYRGTVLALRVRSIGEGAALEVRPASGSGTPVFIRRESARRASPIRQADVPATGVPPTLAEAV
jgi:hypothetical protein